VGVYGSIASGTLFFTLFRGFWKTIKVVLALGWLMKSGQVVKAFSASDGRKVVLRTPRWEDLDGVLELINSLVEEKAEIIVDSKFTREQETDWLGGMLARVERDELFYFVAEVDGRVVASCDLRRGRGSEGHVGVVGIVVKKGFRDLGIGTEIMKAVIGQAVRLGLKLLVLSVFASNERAIHVYEQVGFVQTGRVPKKHFRDGKYVDEIAMAKVLE
jgi:RimJ/RimL family protein N-acetyltransferase